VRCRRKFFTAIYSVENRASLPCHNKEDTVDAQNNRFVENTNNAYARRVRLQFTCSEEWLLGGGGLLGYKVIYYIPVGVGGGGYWDIKTYIISL